MITLDTRVIKRNFQKVPLENLVLYGNVDQPFDQSLTNVKKNVIGRYPFPECPHKELELFPNITVKGSDAIYSGMNDTVFKTIHSDSLSNPTTIVERRFLGNQESNVCKLFKITIRTRNNGTQKLIVPLSYPAGSVIPTQSLIALTTLWMLNNTPEHHHSNAHMYQMVFNNNSLICPYGNQIEALLANIQFTLSSSWYNNRDSIDTVIKTMIERDHYGLQSLLQKDPVGSAYAKMGYVNPQMVFQTNHSNIFYDNSPCKSLYLGPEYDHTDNGWMWGEVIEYIESHCSTDGWIVFHQSNNGIVEMENLYEFSRWVGFSWNYIADIGMIEEWCGVGMTLWTMIRNVFQKSNMEINNVRELGIEWNYDDELRIDILDRSNNKTILYFDLNRCALLTPVVSTDISNFGVLAEEYNLIHNDLLLSHHVVRGYHDSIR